MSSLSKIMLMLLIITVITTLMVNTVWGGHFYYDNLINGTCEYCVINRSVMLEQGHWTLPDNNRKLCMLFNNTLMDIGTDSKVFEYERPGINNTHWMINSNGSGRLKSTNGGINLSQYYQQLTILAWVKRTGGDYFGIINHYGSSESFYYRLNDGYPYILYGNDVNISADQSSVIVPFNEWSHIGIVIDLRASSNNIRYYLNGDHVDSDTGDADTPEIMARATQDFNIGGTNSWAWDQFNGSMTQLMVYNISLSTPQIDDIYKLGLFEEDGTYLSNEISHTEAVDWDHIFFNMSIGTYANFTVYTRSNNLSLWDECALSADYSNCTIITANSDKLYYRIDFDTKVKPNNVTPIINSVNITYGDVSGYILWFNYTLSDFSNINPRQICYSFDTGILCHNSSVTLFSGGQNLQGIYDSTPVTGSFVNWEIDRGLTYTINTTDGISWVGHHLDGEESNPTATSETAEYFWVKEPGTGGENVWMVCVGDTCNPRDPITNTTALAVTWDKPLVGLPENDYPYSVRSISWIPVEDETYDLGSADFRWRNLYLKGNITGTGSGVSVYMDSRTGEARFGFDGFNITQNGTEVSTAGNMELSGNVTAKSYHFSDTTDILEWDIGRDSFILEEDLRVYSLNATYGHYNGFQVEADSGYLYMYDDSDMRFGTSQDAGILFNTVETNDALLIDPDTTSKSVIISNWENRDHQHSTQSHPTLFIHSFNPPFVSTNYLQWLSLTHDGTDGVLTVGKGNIKLNNDTTVNGDVTADAFIGDGSQLTGISGGGLENGSHANFTKVVTQNLTFSKDSEDHVICFHEDGKECGEYFMWDDSGDEFYFSENVLVLGGIRTNKHIYTTGSSYNNIYSAGDMYTTGSGDDFWGGSSNQATAKWGINSTGKAHFKDRVSFATNITLHSPDGTAWNCGVDNTGSFSCS